MKWSCVIDTKPDTDKCLKNGQRERKWVEL